MNCNLFQFNKHQNRDLDRNKAISQAETNYKQDKRVFSLIIFEYWLKVTST